MDIYPTALHLPVNVWIANASLVHEDFEEDGGGSVIKPRIQNIKDIQDQGYALGDYLDDETHTFNEPKERIEVPTLTALGPKIREVFILSGAETVTLPIDAFNYAIYAILHGLDPASIVNDADIRFDVSGYTATDTANPTYDKVGSAVDRVETITTIKFCLLAHIQPADPDLGDKYILCPKLSVDTEQIQQMLSKEYHKQNIQLKANVLTATELTRWQNIMPMIKKTIGLYSFHMDTPET